jgi:hypothetical protein
VALFLAWQYEPVLAASSFVARRVRSRPLTCVIYTTLSRRSKAIWSGWAIGVGYAEFGLVTKQAQVDREVGEAECHLATPCLLALPSCSIPESGPSTAFLSWVRVAQKPFGQELGLGDGVLKGIGRARLVTLAHRMRTV